MRKATANVVGSGIAAMIFLPLAIYSVSACDKVLNKQADSRRASEETDNPNDQGINSIMYSDLISGPCFVHSERLTPLQEAQKDYFETQGLFNRTAETECYTPGKQEPDNECMEQLANSQLYQDIVQADLNLSCHEAYYSQIAACETPASQVLQSAIGLAPLAYSCQEDSDCSSYDAGCQTYYSAATSCTADIGALFGNLAQLCLSMDVILKHCTPLCAEGNCICVEEEQELRTNLDSEMCQQFLLANMSLDDYVSLCLDQP